jgi:hypothetical protein
MKALRAADGTGSVGGVLERMKDEGPIRKPAARPTATGLLGHVLERMKALRAADGTGSVGDVLERMKDKG